MFITALFVHQKTGNSLKISINKGPFEYSVYPYNGTLYNKKIECRYNENQQNTVTCSSVWISKQCRGNVEQKKPNSKEAHTVWIYLIKVQKQEIGISSDSSSSSDRSWDCTYPRRKAVTERDHSVFWDILSCSLLIWEVVIQLCSVCENFMMWAVFFGILYSSKIVKEYINSISTDMKQPARYYVKKKKAWIKHFHRCEKMGSIPVLGYIFIQYFQKDVQETDNFGCMWREIHSRDFCVFCCTL